MSKNTEHTSALLSRVCKQSCEKDSRAVVVDLPREKPHCLSDCGLACTKLYHSHNLLVIETILQCRHL